VSPSEGTIASGVLNAVATVDWWRVMKA